MSIIRTNRIELGDGSQGVETGYVVDGAAKAWLNYNAALSVVKDSLNFSSITDMGTGNFKHNLTNLMGVDYAAQVTWAYQDADASSGAFYYNYAPGQRLTCAAGYSHINQFGSTDSGTSGDSVVVCLVHHGDLV